MDFFSLTAPGTFLDLSQISIPWIRNAVTHYPGCYSTMDAGVLRGVRKQALCFFLGHSISPWRSVEDFLARGEHMKGMI